MTFHPSARQNPPDRPRLGLALSAGVYRGAAHWGVIRALHQAGIAIDLVVGTSAGALAGVMYCAGLPLDLLETTLRSSDPTTLFTPTAGRDGFTDMSPMQQCIERWIGADRDLQGLQRPFACVATDALSGAPVILSEGNAAAAVAASMAVPGLVRPVSWGGRILVDGAVVQPMPVRSARTLGADFVIAVDVNVPRFGSWPARSPSESINHCFDMAMHQLCVDEAETADVLIRPDLAGINQHFKNVGEFLRAGDEAGRSAIPSIHALLRQKKGARHGS